ncbi:MAG: zinc-binding dehydrogenase, partial [Alphaproteobacteria bacterium]|nr:zinc-binding dehydrogenase [Alphaproteobacteria bacterium]
MSRATGLAAVMTAPRRTELREIPLPDIGPDAGLLRVVASGICGSDWGKYTTDKFVPCILGHEIVGYVEKLGAIARARWGIKEGDYVALEEYLPCGHCEYCRNGQYRSCLETDHFNPNGVRYGSTKLDVAPGLYGGYSEFLYLHPRTVFHALPVHIPPHIAAMALPLGNGFQWTFLDAGIGPGKTLVVLGPGQQGCGCVVAAKTAGAENIIVVGLSRDERRFEIVRRLGATHTIAIDKDDVLERVRQITGGQMADVVIEVSNAGPEIVNAGLSLLRKRGKMLCTAWKKNAVPLDVDRLIRYQAELRGVRGHSYQAVELAIRAMNSGHHPLELISTHVLG